MDRHLHGLENVVWDAAIEHFTPDEIASILRNITKRLTPAGILTGYTIVEWSTGEKLLEHHKYEFKNADDLRSMLTPYFRNVRMLETSYPVSLLGKAYPDRHNSYFWTSDRELPL